jgi:hypothetical protein
VGNVLLAQAAAAGSGNSGERHASTALDMFDETDWTDDVYEQAGEYADEQLREWGGHLQWDPEVIKVQLPASSDDEITIWDRHFPGPRSSVTTHRIVTCGCRKHYLVPVLALVYASVRVASGLARPGTWVRPMRAPTMADFPGWRGPDDDVYFFAPDGKLVIDLRERQ